MVSFYKKSDRKLAEPVPVFCLEMGMNVLFFLNSAALGVGLAMDAFSVSMANGLHEPAMSGRRMCLVAGVYALFQYAMPMIGWLCVHTIVELFSAFQHFVPWIALLLLLYIGGKMLLEGLQERKVTVCPGRENGRCPDPCPRRERGEETCPEHGDAGSHTLTGRVLLLQGIATSIDALSVGFTIAEYDAVAANAASLIIAAVTFGICVGGLHIGKRFGTRLTWQASVLGGCILIAIGIEIFVKGML